eukprot:TRINITY_DN104079_c0_g1_i1.p1 TRINITY_DN104079_c0_g1~~TRINITY_DN104079_c0_g1_i1.p1  ORF type:complete len:461 (-),score=144.06 TRINITY_DN104079_c0_g1_i1:148-1410(-)
MDMAQSADLPAMTLRVHGGGGLAASLAATGGAGIPEGLEGLDTHVLDAACRARLTAEERLEREVTRRRELEMERRQRIFDAKRRTIGLDTKTLDAQVADNNLRKQQELQRKNEGAREMLMLDRHLKLQETAKKQMRHDIEKESRMYGMQNLSKQQADTWDLNDPHKLRKDRPMRVGDDDPRCGPASMLKFGGEDLMRDERLRQQRAQQAMFCEQQKFEKAMLAPDDDTNIRREMAEMIALRNEMEAEENNLRYRLRKQQQDENLQAAARRAQDKLQVADEDAQRDAAEIHHHSQDPFLNETTDQLNPNGKIRRAEYKGSTREERLHGRDVLVDQIMERQANRSDDKAEDRMMARNQEAVRRQLLLQERQKQRDRRAAAEENARANLHLRNAKVENTKALNELYTNRFSDEFFGQFGTQTR